jgi:hypothetical protein
MAGTSGAVNLLNWVINGDGLVLGECCPRMAKHKENMAMPERQIDRRGSFFECM